MTGRRFVGLALAALAVAAPMVARPGAAFASCMTGVPVDETVTGIVVSTSIAKFDGIYVQVRSDGGSTRTVVINGRDPTNTDPTGRELMAEDSWEGDLPQEGGTYAFTGAISADDGPIYVNACAGAPSVELLSAPPSSDATASVPESTSTPTTVAEQGASAAGVVAGALGLALGVGVIYVVLRRRGRPSA